MSNTPSANLAGGVHMRTEALGGIGRTGHVGIGSLIASMPLLGWKYGLDMIVGLSAPKKKSLER